MTRFRMSEQTWWRIIAIMLGFMIFLNAFDDGLGRLEGKLFPVKNETTLFNIRDKGAENRILFDGMATKHRDCPLDHVEWYYGAPSGESFRLDLIRRGRPEFDRPGKYYFNNWELYITPSDLLERTYALAYHQCHPFYKTITLFFKGSKGNVMDTNVRDPQWHLLGN